MQKKVIITGGSGFLGSAISSALLAHQYDVVSLDLLPPRNARVMFVEADMVEGIPHHHFLEKPTYVINLAGESIFGRWNNQKKERIYHSRVQGTKNLVDLFSNPLYRPEAMISASMIGIYGNSGTMTVDERSEAGEGFLARVAIDWEAAAKSAEHLGVRTTIIRNGHIIGGGGLMAKFKPFTKLHLIPQALPGQVCFSWIHEYDIVRLYTEAMSEPTAPSIINAVAPKISTVGEFSRVLASQSRSKVILVPRFMVEPFVGDLVNELEYSQCVRANTISGQFRFKYPSLPSAIKEVLNR